MDVTGKWSTLSDPDNNSKSFPTVLIMQESILGSFTTKSDVWAFGIFLWELFELGKAPYAYTNDPQEVFNFIDRGGRLPQPRECPLPLYQLMLRMWAGNPNKRPHFEEISEELARISKLVPAACDMFSDGDPGIDGT